MRCKFISHQNNFHIVQIPDSFHTGMMITNKYYTYEHKYSIRILYCIINLSTVHVFRIQYSIGIQYCVFCTVSFWVEIYSRVLYCIVLYCTVLYCTVLYIIQYWWRQYLFHNDRMIYMYWYCTHAGSWKVPTLIFLLYCYTVCPILISIQYSP